MTQTVQCQRWRGRRQSWQPATPGERFDAARYMVLPIFDDTTAKNYILTHHYSGSYVSALHRFGLYRDTPGEGMHLVGVAVYSSPVTAEVLTSVLPDLEPFNESVELGRFVLDDDVEGNAESWFIARCHEYLLAMGVRGVVSFADPMPRRLPDGTIVAPGHVGIIYQAVNAIYTGRAYARSLWVLPDATIFNGKTLQKIRKQESGHEYAERTLISWGARPMRAGEDPKAWLKEAKVAARVVTDRHPGNHRYVILLGANKRARNRIHVAKEALPYPKHIETRELVAA